MVLLCEQDDSVWVTFDGNFGNFPDAVSIHLYQRTDSQTDLYECLLSADATSELSQTGAPRLRL